MFSKHKFLIQSFIVGAGAMLALPLAAFEPVGELQISGSARIQSSGTRSEVRLVDTTYTWVSGDRLTTRESNGILNLAAGGSLGIDEHSEVAISAEGSKLSAEISTGSLLYALPGDAELVIAAAGYRFQTFSGETRALRVSDGESSFAGIVNLDDEGQVRVNVRAGELHVAQGADRRYVINAGERARFRDGAVEIINVQLDPEVLEEDDDDRGAGFWIRNNPGLFALALVGGVLAGYGIYRWIDDDGDDRVPVSP